MVLSLDIPWYAAIAIIDTAIVAHSAYDRIALKVTNNRTI